MTPTLEMVGNGIMHMHYGFYLPGNKSSLQSQINSRCNQIDCQRTAALTLSFSLEVLFVETLQFDTRLCKATSALLACV